MGLRFTWLCVSASAQQGKDREMRDSKAGVCGSVRSFLHRPHPLHCAWYLVLAELSAALTASCSHSLHRPAEVVVSDGALPAWGGVQSAPRPVGLELQQWTQSQNHQGIQGWTLRPPLLFPLHLGWERGSRTPGGCWCFKVRSANLTCGTQGTPVVHVGSPPDCPPRSVLTLGAGVCASDLKSGVSFCSHYLMLHMPWFSLLPGVSLSLENVRSIRTE